MTANWRLRPKWMPTLATLAGLPLLLQLGLWQWHKAEAKERLQLEIDALAKAPPLVLGPRRISGEGLRYHRVAVRGRYEAEHQIFFDNQVRGEQAGYYVLTPLRIEGGEVRLLVNRGWVAQGRTRDELPEIPPPTQLVVVNGMVWEPPRPTLSWKSGQEMEAEGRVWQVLDLGRYAAQVPYPLQPFAIRLDPDGPGCYVCEWPRVEERVGMHRGYALQWFGMAMVLLAFYLGASIERRGNGDETGRK